MLNHIWFMLKLAREKKFDLNYAVIILALFSVIYMWSFNSRYIIPMDYKPHYDKTPIVDYLKDKQNEEPFRTLVLPKVLRDYYLSFHGIEELSLTMLHGNHLATFEKFAGRGEGQLPNLLIPSVMNLCNTKFILSNQQLPPDMFPPDQFKQIKSFGNLKVIQNNNYLPRAFPVYDYKVITDEKQILNTILSPGFDYRSTVILEEDPEIAIAPKNDSTEFEVVPARMYDMENGSFKVDVEMLADGLLFISENYYHAWKAYVNDEQVKTLKADFTFRAIPLRKGKHTVEYRFENGTYSAALAISGTTFVLLIAALIGILIREKIFPKRIIKETEA